MGGPSNNTLHLCHTCGTAGEAPDLEGLGDALGVLSHKLRMSGFLTNDVHHAAYEKVVAEFQALSSKKGAGHA